MKKEYSLFSESYERTVKNVTVTKHDLRILLQLNTDLVAEERESKNVFAVPETVLLHKYDNLIFL